jgi:hypothetical protein
MEESNEMSNLLLVGNAHRARVRANREVNFINAFGLAELQQRVGAVRRFKNGLRLPDPEPVDEVSGVSRGCVKMERPE